MTVPQRERERGEEIGGGEGVGKRESGNDWRVYM